MSYDIGATGAVDADYFAIIMQAANYAVTSRRSRRKTGLAASTALVSKYKTSAGAAHFLNRTMIVMPVKVG